MRLFVALGPANEKKGWFRGGNKEGDVDELSRWWFIIAAANGVVCGVWMNRGRKLK